MPGTPGSDSPSVPSPGRPHVTWSGGLAFVARDSDVPGTEMAGWGGMLVEMQWKDLEELEESGVLTPPAVPSAPGQPCTCGSLDSMGSRAERMPWGFRL